MKTGVSAKQKFAAERKDALRESLKARGHETHAFDLIKKIQNLDNDLNAVEVNRLRIAIDGHFKFLNKYLPDLKAVEHTIGDDGANTVEDHARVIGELISFPNSRAAVSTGKNT
jgi:hypothetical protein